MAALIIVGVELVFKVLLKFLMTGNKKNNKESKKPDTAAKAV